VVTADAGVYMCKAINSAGEAVSSISLKVKCKFDILHLGLFGFQIDCVFLREHSVLGTQICFCVQVKS
jgi:hypothetical protein